MIKPTVGRKVWCWPSTRDFDGGMARNGNEPLDATIVAVHSDRMVNVVVNDANGEPWKRTSVTLQQSEDEPSPGFYCQWMPFQAAQASKAEKPTIAQLENRYQHHPPKGDQAERYTTIRRQIFQTAMLIVSLSPVSPEQARALDALDNAMMLANAAIARNE